MAGAFRLQHLGRRMVSVCPTRNVVQERSMSTFWAQRPAGAERRHGWPRAVPDLPHESIADQGWDERVAREVRHLEVIEASFDRAEAYQRLGDFEHALEWLDRAAALSGGLPPAYRTRRARWARAAAVQPQPVRGDWKNRLARSGEGAAGR